MSDTLENMIIYLGNSKRLREGKITPKQLSHRNDSRIRRENKITALKYGLVSVALLGGLLYSTYLIGQDIIPSFIEYIIGEDSESIKYAPTDELWKSREK